MKKLLYLSGALAALAITALPGTAVRSNDNGNAPRQKLMMTEAIVSQFYVDTVNEDRLVEDAIKGMLEGLDPHSSYSNPEETRELNEPLEGNFSGIGITFNMNRDTLYIIQTVSGGPSEKVGILAGDRIVAVNDTAIAGQKLKNSQIMKKLRGPKGTTVDLKVLRRSAGKDEPINFRVTRDDIPIFSVDAAYMVDSITGYIRLNKFAADTPKEMRDAISTLKSKGMTQMILDLTDNGGGYLNAAVDLLGELLPSGSLAVYTEGENSPRYDFVAQPKGFSKPLFEDGKVVVMLNQYSASASEITAGAIQDWDRGAIVGRRSFGKGLVQRPFPFPDGSMIRLTVAHYYTPTGRDIQKPYVKGKGKDYNKDISDRFDHGELMHADSIKHVDSLKVLTKRLNREIYGGGGITPDHFVPLDTTEFTKYYREILAKGLINQFVIEYVDAHRKEIKHAYPDDDRFLHGFTVTDTMLARLKEMADNEKIEYNEEQFATSRPLIAMQLKALIGRDIFDNATYFKVYNQHDPIFREALRVIHTPDPLAKTSK